MDRRALLIEHDAVYAQGVARALQRAECETVHVRSEVAAVREITSGFFDLVIVGIQENRKKEGLRFIETLLKSDKVAGSVMVVSNVQDPGYVRTCIGLGVVDYVLYPEDPEELLVRAEVGLEKSGGVGEALVRVAAIFLGPAARVFLEMQTKARLSLQSLSELRRDHLPDLAEHLNEVVRPILKGKVDLFINRIKQVFHIRTDT